MKIFFIKSMVFTAIVLLIYMSISLSYKPNINIRNDYMASIIDKHARLNQAGNNRIILVGGSNLAFGISSEEIQKGLNRNVVNMGLHAGLGLDFIFNEALSEVRTGDIIVLSIEYPLYDQNFEPDIELIDHTQRIFPSLKSYYRFSFNELRLLSYKYFTKTIFSSIQIDTVSVYNRKSFNSWGDVVAHIGSNSTFKANEKAHRLNKIILDGTIKKFRKFNANCKLVGAKLFIAFPNYPESLFQLNKIVIMDLESQIREKMNFIPIINTPETFVFPDSYFFDTVYHLNGMGIKKRTDIFVSMLNNSSVLETK